MQMHSVILWCNFPKIIHIHHILAGWRIYANVGSIIQPSEDKNVLLYLSTTLTTGMSCKHTASQQLDQSKQANGNGHHFPKTFETEILQIRVRYCYNLFIYLLVSCIVTWLIKRLFVVEQITYYFSTDRLFSNQAEFKIEYGRCIIWCMVNGRFAGKVFYLDSMVLHLMLTPIGPK